MSGGFPASARRDKPAGRMDILLMYILMIVDLAWTLMHHEEVGELNPVFTRLLMGNEVAFVYLKLAANTVAAFIVIYLRPRRPIISRVLTIFGILIYGVVVWLHWFVDFSIAHADELENTGLWNLMQGR
jgi:hypothetical protein